MKTKLSLLALLFTFSFLLAPCFGQVPQGFNYQAVARDGVTKNVLANQTLQVMLYIQSSPTGGTIFWKELHNPVTTNDFGMFTVVLGTGVRQTPGSTVASFDLIDWKVTPKYVKTEINYSGSWKDMGNASQLWSVPYAMNAKSIGAGNLNIKGTATNPDSALFEVKNKDDQTIFAVYSEGVRMWVSDGNKGKRGGFAVGGFGTDKATSQQYLYVTDTCTRISVMNTGKGQRGGFAVGGFDNIKGTVTPFTSLTPDNYFIGHEGGSSLTTGKYNSILGYQSGKYITSGESNAFIGYQSGFSNNSGSGNLFLGYKTGYSNVDGNYNSFLGYLAGQSNSTGVFNTFLGSFSGFSNKGGSNNTFVGDSTGYKNLTGSRNTFLGTGCGLLNIEGADNVFIGTSAGRSNTTGFNNVFIGNQTGRSNLTGFSNVMIGINAGYMFDGYVGNTFIGDNAGRNAKNSDKNVFLGAFSGYNGSLSEQGSWSSVFIGNSAGYNSHSGGNNVFIGFESGYDNVYTFGNVFLGYLSGRNNKTGNDNVYIGSEAGKSNTNGFQNVFLGRQSGMNNTEGDDNLFFGYRSGFSNTTGSGNVLLGWLSGELSTTAWGNTFVGTASGAKVTVGQDNVFVGTHAGENTDTSQGNVIVGAWSGDHGTMGDFNTIVGTAAGRNISGVSNVIIGGLSGEDNFTGSGNVFIGTSAGRHETRSNRLYIDNSDSDSTWALIWGNFDRNLLRFNGNVGIGGHPSDNAKLSVNNPYECAVMEIKGTGNTYHYSQILLKSQETTVSKAWEINHTKGNEFGIVYYDGGSTWTPYLNITPGGVMTVGSSTVTSVRLDVMGNARFRSVGSGAYSAPLNIMSDGTLTVSSSDSRLKTNISDISDALAKILALRGVRYNWLSDKYAENKIGFVAQEVEQVLPELVFTNPVDGYRGVNYAEMTAVLTEAVKEQQRQIEVLNERIEKLEKLVREKKVR